MNFKEYKLNIDKLCNSEFIVEHDHYFAAQALIDTTKENDGSYCLSRIQNCKLHNHVENLINCFKNGNVNAKLLKIAAIYHGSCFLASAPVELDIQDFLEEGLEEVNYHPNSVQLNQQLNIEEGCSF
ncbi:MAG: hypothetical protein QW751_00120 [Candidatus Aenigmatarchaeota archaeon]